MNHAIHNLALLELLHNAVVWHQRGTWGTLTAPNYGRAFIRIKKVWPQKARRIVSRSKEVGMVVVEVAIPSMEAAPPKAPFVPTRNVPTKPLLEPNPTRLRVRLF